MSGNPNSDRRSARRAAAAREIVDAAWTLAAQRGLAGISMRDLGAAVNMRAQSIYTYFRTKNDIYDAMFAQGYRQFNDSFPDFPTEIPPGLTSHKRRELIAVHLQKAATAYFDFCTNDPVRYQLLFQRVVPDFEPSPESWAIALEYYDKVRQAFAVIDIVEQSDLDLWTALLTGLVDQQISNDPTGRRWYVLIDSAVEMFLAHIDPPPAAPRTENHDAPKENP